MFRPGGRDENYRNDLDFLAHTTFILRQNNDAFLIMTGHRWLRQQHDNVYVNRWKSGDKTIYTVLNMRSQVVEWKTFQKPTVCRESIMFHCGIMKILLLSLKMEKHICRQMLTGWHPSFSGTRREGSVDCIAEFPNS